MIESILRFSIARRWLMMTMILALMGLGYWSYQKLPIDAVPDITNVQVQINTRAPGYSPLETEQRITFPIETAITGIPNLSYTRSISRYGLSQVTVVFVFVVSHVLFSHVIVIELSLSTAQCILKPTPYNSPVTIELPLLTF